MRKTARGNFFNLYRHGFVRLAVCVPEVPVADPGFNGESCIRLAVEAAENDAVLALFPELVLSAYSNEDLFHQDALLEGALKALERLVKVSRNLDTILLAGFPLRVDAMLFNCAAVIHRGRILGVPVKSYLPNYREFYEARQFASASEARSDTIDLLGQKDIPFGPNLLFTVENIPGFTLFTEICEDLWVPIPPSSYACLAGATVIANLSASNVTVEIGRASCRERV